MLSSSPALPQFRPHSAHVSQARRVHLPSFEEEGKESGCVCLFHFCTGSEERYLRAWCLRRKKLVLVPTSARGCRWRSQCSTFHWFQTDGKVSFSGALLLLLPSFLSSLLQQSPPVTAWRRTFSSFSQSSWSDVYRKQFLEVCSISRFCTVSLYEETHDLVQNENPSVGTNMTCRVNMNLASCHGPNSFLLQLQWHPWNYSGRKSDAYSHITKWLFMRMCY